MNKLVILAIIILGVALVGSNGWWVYNAIDQGITLEYQQMNLEDNRIALAQTLAIVPLAVQSDVGREEIIRTAAEAANEDPKNSFEKDGYVWIGRIGIKFSENGKVEDVMRGWDPP